MNSTMDSTSTKGMVSEEQAERLRCSEPVRAAMRDPRLQQLVRSIDGADSREAALRRLEAALVDTDFVAFKDDVCRAIGLATEQSDAQP